MILLGDLRAYRDFLRRETDGEIDESHAALRWVAEVLRPGMASAHRALGGVGSPVQAYCDLLEARWLLSEQAGHDVGSDAALTALQLMGVPADAAATMKVADMPTGQFPSHDDMEVDPR